MNAFSCLRIRSTFLRLFWGPFNGFTINSRIWFICISYFLNFCHWKETLSLNINRQTGYALSEAFLSINKNSKEFGDNVGETFSSCSNIPDLLQLIQFPKMNSQTHILPRAERVSLPRSLSRDLLATLMKNSGYWERGRGQLFLAMNTRVQRDRLTLTRSSASKWSNWSGARVSLRLRAHSVTITH